MWLLSWTTASLVSRFHLQIRTRFYPCFMLWLWIASCLQLGQEHHKAAVKLDSKMTACLQHMASLKMHYEELRESRVPPCPSGTVSSSPLQHQKVQPVVVPDSTETARPKSKSASLNGSETLSTEGDPYVPLPPRTFVTTENKIVTTRTLEKDEILEVCRNLFAELKADENLISLKYLTKVPTNVLNCTF